MKRTEENDEAVLEVEEYFNTSISEHPSHLESQSVNSIVAEINEVAFTQKLHEVILPRQAKRLVSDRLRKKYSHLYEDP